MSKNLSPGCKGGKKPATAASQSERGGWSASGTLKHRLNKKTPSACVQKVFSQKKNLAPKS